jgi:DivIVA domain-containing protein
MAATRLDHPVLISAEQVRRREFVTTRRGYDPDQVRSYLEELAGQMELMTSMVREARMEAETAISATSPSVDPYERLATRVASLLREADETADRVRGDARRDAERIMLEARADADRVRTDAQAKAEEARADAERTLTDAHEKADRAISGLATRKEALVEQLAQMQGRLLGVALDLEAAIESPADSDEEVPLGASEDAHGDGPIVDLRTEEPAAEPTSEVRRIVADHILDGLDDPSYEELWDGTETIQLEVPDMPPLDLSWGDDDLSSP